MLKARNGQQIWLTQQHHHAQLSGFLAAHWGGADFVTPGHYSGASHPAKWRDEVVLAIAEHDNGWWETEAMPIIGQHDGLPVGVGDMTNGTEKSQIERWASQGFERWLIGIHRLSSTHPYAALLVSMHAYWLYAVAFDHLRTASTESLRHFVFGSPEIVVSLVKNREKTLCFLNKIKSLQKNLHERIAQDEIFARALKPHHLHAHTRLLQLFDTMSVLLALQDTKDHLFEHVPRAGWHDLRCTLSWKRLNERVIELDPYPFGHAPLNVSLPVRIVSRPLTDEQMDSPMSYFHALPMTLVHFQFVGRHIRPSI